MKNTSYFKIAELVLALLESYEINGVFEQYDEDVLIQVLLPYFKFASGELENIESGINTSRDDTILQFNPFFTSSNSLLTNCRKYVIIYTVEGLT